MGSFKIGDRVNCHRIGVNGTIASIDRAGWAIVTDDIGNHHFPHTSNLTLISAAPPEDDWSFTYEPPKPKVCTCGGAKAKTTCSLWCDSLPDAPAPFRMPEKLSF